jgi:uncharacterized protein involved in exopolysaccharide biosynthesis
MLIEIVNISRYYINVVICKPLFFVLPLVLTFSAGLYYIVNMKPNYYAEAFLLLEFQHIPSSLVSPTVTNDRLQFIEERVFTRNKLISIAQKFDLFPDARAKLSKTQLATLVRNKITLRTFTTEGTDEYASTASVRIGFSDRDARVAAAATNELVAMIVEENRRSRTSRATEATKFLMQEVGYITARLRAREVEWARYLEANRHVQPSQVPALLIELQAKELELASVNQAKLVLDEDVKLLQGQMRLRADQVSDVSSIRSQLSALKAEISERSVVYSDNHPKIQMLKQRLDELTAQATKASSNPASAEDQAQSPELRLLAERIANAKPRQEASLALSKQLTERIDWLKIVISRAPEVESKLAAIHAEKQGIQRSLSDMQSKLDTARLGERLELGNAASKIEVMETPEVPAQRAGPGRRLLLMILAGISVLAGAVGTYLADSFDETIRGSFDLANALQGQELIMIPNWTPDVRARRRWLRWWSNGGPITTSHA